jgi:hypothetical protein
MNNQKRKTMNNQKRKTMNNQKNEYYGESLIFGITS